MKLSNLLLAATILVGSTSAMAQSITGAGSTFGAPIYGKWSEKSKSSTGVELNYQAIGSGAGINQIIGRTVDFGATDMPLSSEKLATNSLVQVPTVMGAVVMIVNIPGVDQNRLKLSPEVLADIYLGKITKWNDPRIVADNADLALPALAIAPVYRADGSGTTFVFTSYLNKISADWLKSVGSATSVKWPAGTGGKGNDGISATVKQVKGAIGYVESAYASSNHLITARLKNASGAWVSPTAQSFSKTAEKANWSGAADFAVDLLNLPGDDSWPIMSATFLLIPTNAKEPAQTLAVIKWLTWSYKNGNDTATSLEYVPLPASVQTQALNKLVK